MARLTIRIDFDAHRAFGPGKVRLLECVEKEGSIRGAAAALGMSYRRAWILLREIRDIVGAPVTATARGAYGGGTVLTEIARAIVLHYRRIERRAERSAERDLAALKHIVGGAKGGTPRPARTRSSGAMPKAKRRSKEGRMAQ